MTLGHCQTTLGADDDEIGGRTPDQGPLAIQVRKPADAISMTDEKFRERMREVNDRCPGSVRLFDRLEATALEALHIPGANPSRDTCSAVGLERDDVGHAEFGGLFDHPPEAIAVAGANREGEGDRSRILRHGLDLYGSPTLPDAFGTSPVTIEQQERSIDGDTPDLEMMNFALGEEQCSSRRQGSGVDEDRDHRAELPRAHFIPRAPPSTCSKSHRHASAVHPRDAPIRGRVPSGDRTGVPESKRGLGR